MKKLLSILQTSLLLSGVLLVLVLLALPVEAGASTHDIGSWAELQEAISNAADGDIINITADIELEDYFNISDKTLTISSTAPHTIDCGNYCIYINSGADVTLGENITITGGSAGTLTAVYAIDGGKVTIDGCTIDSSRAYGLRVQNNGSAVIKNGFIKGTDCGLEVGSRVEIRGGTISGQVFGVYASLSSIVEISGGEINGKTGLRLYNSTATISGGTITASGDSFCNGIHLIEGSTAEISGSAYITVSDGGRGVHVENGTVRISGGTITATDDYCELLFLLSNGTAEISGGAITANRTGIYGIYFNGGGTAAISGGTIAVSGTDVNGIYFNGGGTATISGGTITASGTNVNGIYFYEGGTANITVSPELSWSGGVFGNGKVLLSSLPASVTVTTGETATVTITGAEVSYTINEDTDSELNASIDSNTATLAPPLATPPGAYSLVLAAQPENAELKLTIPVSLQSVVNIAAIPGVIAPVSGAAPVTAITETEQYTGSVTWIPDHTYFAGGTEYTAIITLTPKAGYTLYGVPENFFTVDGALLVIHSPDSGVITATFPPAKYTVTYHANGGTGTPPTESPKDPGDSFVAALNTLDPPPGTHKKFIGWNLSDDGTGENYEPWDIVSMPANDLILYANWVLPQLTGSISINGETKCGSTLAVSSLTYTPDTDDDMPYYQWKRDGDDIPGATNSTYTLTLADVGSMISVTVTADGVHATGSLTSVEVGPVTSVPVTSITVKGTGNVTTVVNGDTLQMIAEVLPGDASDNTVTWSVSNGTGSAVIDPSGGLLTGTGLGTVTVRATANDGSGVYGETTITVIVSEMGGLVTINGVAKYGEELTAELSGITYTPDTIKDVPTYQWKRDGADIPGATGLTYTLGLDDIGKVITVTVTADGDHAIGSVTSSPTAIIEKADGPAAPAAPELDSKTYNSVTLVANPAHEYMVEGGTWQDSPVFTGLTPNTTYTFTARVKETATHKASAASLGLTVTTDPAYTVIFDSQGGSPVASLSGVVPGSTITEPAAPTRTGYTFGGWYKEAAYVNAWNFSSDTVNADITLYAKWTANSSGSDSSGSEDSYTPQPVTATRSINAATGGEVSYEGVQVTIPAGTLPQDAIVSISKLTGNQISSAVPGGLQVKLGSDIYEITTSGARDFGDKTITIKIPYDPAKIGAGELPFIHYRDEVSGEWVEVPTTLEQGADGKWYAVTKVNHLTKFAVFSTQKKQITLVIGQKNASLNGDPYLLDAAPYLDVQAGRTLVPLRFISEALGTKVDWEATTRQVKVSDGSKELLLTLDSAIVYINGQAVTIDCAPVSLPPGRTFVPLRFVSENLGAQVDYAEATQEIRILR